MQGKFTSDAKPQKSKYRGVSYNKKKGWGASIQFKGNRTFCGWHKTEEAAKEAYDKKARDLKLEKRVNDKE